MAWALTCDVYMKYITQSVIFMIENSRIYFLCYALLIQRSFERHHPHPPHVTMLVLRREKSQRNMECCV